MSNEIVVLNIFIKEFFFFDDWSKLSSLDHSDPHEKNCMCNLVEGYALIYEYGRQRVCMRKATHTYALSVIFAYQNITTTATHRL